MEESFTGSFDRSFLNSSFLWPETMCKKLRFELLVTQILNLTEQQEVTPYTQPLFRLCVEKPTKERKN